MQVVGDQCYIESYYCIYKIFYVFNCKLLESAPSFQLKWCAWVAIFCSCISFSNCKVSDDTKQMLSSFM